jgi:hypothetical protein
MAELRSGPFLDADLRSGAAILPATIKLQEFDRFLLPLSQNIMTFQLPEPLYNMMTQRELLILGTWNFLNYLL